MVYESPHNWVFIQEKKEPKEPGVLFFFIAKKVRNFQLKNFTNDNDIHYSFAKFLLGVLKKEV